MYEFAKELFIDERAIGNKSTRDKSPPSLLKSPGVMISASGFTSCYKKKSFSKTRFSSSVANELCDKLKVLLQEKQAGNNSDPFIKKLSLYQINYYKKSAYLRNNINFHYLFVQTN